MKTKRHSYLLSLLLLLIAASALGQGQVFIMGQMASFASSTRFTEAMKIKTDNPASYISMKTKANNSLVKTTLYTNSSRIILSSIALNKGSRTITAALTSGSLPDETTLKLNIGEPSSNFKGYPGAITSSVVLGNADVAVIREITTCTSGKKPEDGYGLEYACEMPAKRQAYKSLQGKSITVTFTVSSNPESY